MYQVCNYVSSVQLSQGSPFILNTSILSTSNTHCDLLQHNVEYRYASKSSLMCALACDLSIVRLNESPYVETDWYSIINDVLLTKFVNQLQYQVGRVVLWSAALRDNNLWKSPLPRQKQQRGRIHSFNANHSVI